MKLKMRIYNIVLVIFILFFIVVCSLIYKDSKEMYDAVKTYGEIKEQCVSEPKKKNKKNINWDRLYKINPDIVAWIEIPGTAIDYPIVRTRDYDFYLSHDIYKRYSKYGTLFIDQRLYKKPFKSTNLIVYGHNMGRYTDIMFSSLMQYKKQGYCDKHKYIHLYVKGMEKKQIFRIVSVMEVQSSSEAYKVNFHKDEYMNWRQSITDKSIVDCGQDNLNVEEQMLTLSTCTYSSNRLVLHCVPN